MSAIDVALYGIIAVIAGGIVLWLLFCTFSGQTKPPSNPTEETLKRLIGSIGRATSDITKSTGTVLVNSEEFSAKTSKRIIQKGTHVRVRDTEGLRLLVEKAQTKFLAATARIAAVVALVARPCPDHNHPAVLTSGSVRLVIEARERSHQLRSLA